jgi:hypothetical protein
LSISFAIFSTSTGLIFLRVLKNFPPICGPIGLCYCGN